MGNAGFFGFVVLLVLASGVLLIPDLGSWTGTDDGILIAWAVLFTGAISVASR